MTCTGRPPASVPVRGRPSARVHSRVHPFGCPFEPDVRWQADPHRRRVTRRGAEAARQCSSDAVAGTGPVCVPWRSRSDPRIKRTLAYLPEHAGPYQGMPERAGCGNYGCPRVSDAVGQVRSVRTQNEPTAPIVSSDNGRLRLSPTVFGESQQCDADRANGGAGGANGGPGPRRPPGGVGAPRSLPAPTARSGRRRAATPRPASSGYSSFRNSSAVMPMMDRMLRKVPLGTSLPA